MIDYSPTPNTELSAYEKAAQVGIDPRCVPQHLEETPPVGTDIPYPIYSRTDQESWQILFNRQMELLPGRAGMAFMEGVQIMQLKNSQIPALRKLSQILKETTQWQIARIPGLLHERDFFELLAQRIFPSTDYIRGRHEIDYTPAPDLFHDIFGHMPMLTEPAFADFYQLFGKAALNASGSYRPMLERLHWFTVEFGLVKQDDGERIFGAGILSSKDEVTHALSDKVTKIPFDINTVIRQDYDVWHLQDVLFVLDSFEQLVDAFKAWTKKNGLL